MTEGRDEFASDDEALSALLDGSLPSEQAAALRAQLEREPALAARFAAMQRADRAVRDAYRDVVEEPLPKRVLELLEASRVGRSKVVELEARRRRASPVWLPHAAAAGIALAIGLALGYGAGQRSSETVPSDRAAATGVVAVGSPLHTLLESVPSGEMRALDGALSAEARLTFRAVDGAWCRELIVGSAAASNAALACRRDDAWRIELVAVATAGGELYRPAGAGNAPFEQAVDAIIAGEPLEADAERAVLDGGWQGN